MKKGLTELVFILDRSGSMRGLEGDTLGGYNSMLDNQRCKEGEALVTTVLFDHEIQTLHDRVPMRRVSLLSERDYTVRGSTALLDAMGSTIEHIATIHRYARDEDVPEKTLFVVVTDGMENASRHYRSEDVKRLVEKKKEAGWEFLFLGANMDAIAAAGQLGVSADRAVCYESDSLGTRLNHQVLDKVVTRLRQAPNTAAFVGSIDADNPLEEIRADFRRRHRR